MDLEVTSKRIIKSIANPILDFSGIYDALLSRRVFAQSNWLILMYHRVSRSAKDDPLQFGMCVERDFFARQVEFHVQHFTPITVGDAVARIRAGKPLPRNAVSITFDDGYLDFKEVALPILKRYQCPSTMFITTGGLEKNETFWWDRLIEAVTLTRKKQLDAGFLAPDGSAGQLSLAPLNRRRTMVRLQKLLWDQPPARIDEQVERLREQLGVTTAGPLQAARMRHSDIEDIAREDVELGAHCEWHVDMRRLSSDACVHELDASRRLLTELGNQPVNGFAYPGGRQNPQVQKLVAHAGFTYAAGTDCGLNRQPYDMFNLRRLGMPDADVPEYKRCLAAAAGSAPPAVKYESVPWP